MVKATRDTQRLPQTKAAYSDELKTLDQRIKDQYLRWNHSDIFPDLTDLLRHRSDVVCEQNMVRESIESLSRAISYDPMSGINFSMRGRRYINSGDFAQACADFTMASRLIPEDWYVWYHLGLCHLILGNNRRAEDAYKICACIPTTDSLTVALKNWMWIAYMRQGKETEAEALLAGITQTMAEMDGTENYLRMVLLYRGELTPEAVMALPEGDEEPVLSVTTQGFGVANYYLYREKNWDAYCRTLDLTLEAGREEAWMCFGYAAAEYERAHIKERW